MANSIDSSLPISKLASNAAALMSPLVAPLAAITTFAQGAVNIDGGLTYQTPVVTATGAAQTNPTNFQSGDATLTPAPVVGAHITRSGNLSNANRNQGFTTAHLLPSITRQFTSDAWALWIAQVTTANFAAPSATVAIASFAASTVSTLAQAVAGVPRALITTTQAVQGVQALLRLGDDGIWYAPGFDGGVFEASMSGTSNNAYAIAATPEAMVGVIAQPPTFQTGSAGDFETAPIELPGLGVVAYVSRWFDRPARTEWITVEAIVGFKPGNASALRFIASA